MTEFKYLKGSLFSELLWCCLLFFLDDCVLLFLGQPSLARDLRLRLLAFDVGGVGPHLLLDSVLSRQRLILLNIKKNFQNDSKESIFADMLSSNMRWVFLTIHTCIGKVSDRVDRQRGYQYNRFGNENSLIANERFPIMNDLRPFGNIIQQTAHLKGLIVACASSKRIVESFK